MSTQVPVPEPEGAHQPTPYELMGGAPAFAELVHRFYAGVAVDPILRPLYPEEDLGPAEERFRMFLEQYWGGPRTYSDQRGHPRLRMRHAPFEIRQRERDAWLARMRTALDGVEMAEEPRAMLWDYLEHSATFMINTPEDEDPPAAGKPQA